MSIYSETDLEEYFEMRPKGKSDVFRKLVRGTWSCLLPCPTTEPQAYTGSPSAPGQGWCQPRL